MIPLIQAHLVWSVLILIGLIVLGRKVLKTLGGFFFLLVLMSIFKDSGWFGSRSRRRNPPIVTAAKLFTIGMVLFLLYYGLFMKH